MSSSYVYCQSAEEVLTFVNARLKTARVQDVVARQVTLISEEVVSLVMEELNPDRVHVAYSSSFGQVSFRISFKGELPADFEDDNPSNLAAKIIRYHSNRIKIRYSNGITTISITAVQSMLINLSFDFIAFLLALVAAFLLLKYMPQDMLQVFQNKILSPAADVFSNIVYLIGPPVTFLCIVSNISFFMGMRDRFKYMGRLELRYFWTSLWAVLIGIGMFFLFLPVINMGEELKYLSTGQDIGITMSNIVNAIANLIPDNIFQPVLDGSTLSLCFLAIITGIAVGLVDRETGKIKDLVDLLKSVFCKILAVLVYYTPFIIFITVLSLVIYNGPIVITYILILLLCLILVAILLCVSYAAQLMFYGINPSEFLSKAKDCFIETFKVGSSTDSVPTTIKYCVNSLKIPRDIAEVAIPTGAAINMDGVCIVETMLILALAYMSGVDLSLDKILLVGIMIVFVSFGAPNQPGTVTIVSTVILPLIGVNMDAIQYVILIEILFNRVLSTLDVAGDVICAKIVAVQLEKEKNNNDKK